MDYCHSEIRPVEATTTSTAEKTLDCVVGDHVSQFETEEAG